MATLTFDPNPTTPEQAIVVCFDAEGFSKFCNHPDRQAQISRFAYSVFQLLDKLTISPVDYIVNRPLVAKPRIVAPNFIKFTGDGGILIWTGSEKRFDKNFRTLLVATMRRYQLEYREAVPEWESEWCATDLPKKIRVGIAMGLVYPLKAPPIILLHDETIDYVGYCINLAVRLQSHCREVGFVVQKCVSPELANLKCFSALGMKGAANEPVWLFEDDLEVMKANPGLWQTKFRPA